LAAKKIRAARALLDWSRRRLAKESGLSLFAVGLVERGWMSTADIVPKIAAAFERNGIKFTAGPGNEGVALQSHKWEAA
jgi:DNA-binding XRE family transcriptional regulator